MQYEVIKLREKFPALALHPLDILKRPEVIRHMKIRIARPDSFYAASGCV